MMSRGTGTTPWLGPGHFPQEPLNGESLSDSPAVDMELSILK
jgi:hypothetical protein